ncbi:MAG: DNA replication/repair protein RecF [Pseudomonadota bacterium]|nr:DNA replication/repair protein RecF [Pseudomonadota bacterium]
MPRAVLRSLSLTEFRSYERAELALEGGPVVLFGPNGAGKTNLLEAVSYLAPGKGLRGASAADVGRRLPGERSGRPWAVSTAIETGEGEVRVGTGTEGGARRLVRIDGAPAPPARLSEVLRLVWLTPQQDRLFLEGSTERRRFFDRLTFAAEPSHASAAAAYEKALRERMRLLTDGPRDPAWLDALEARLGEAGAALALARTRTLRALQAEIEARAARPFPLADVALSGEFGTADESTAFDDLAGRISEALRRSRERDAIAGRALAGPHRTDLLVIHRSKNRPAGESSTGEQKALILNIVLAQAARLARAGTSPGNGPNPVILLDEVAAHLDAGRRAALFEEILALKLQAFLTGTDASLFEGLRGRAQSIEVDAGRLTSG